MLLRNRGPFLSSPCSAAAQVCRSWEGAQPGSQPSLASGNILYRRCDARFVLGVGWGQASEFCKIREFCEFHGRCLGTGCLVGCWVVRKIVSCITFFAYSFIIIIHFFVVLLNCLYLDPRVLLSVHPPPQPSGCTSLVAGEQLSGAWLPS